MVKRLELGQGLKQLWQKVYPTNLIKTPFFKFDWHQNFFETLGQDAEWVVLIFNNLVIGSFTKNGELISFSGGDEVADYQDLIGPEEQKSQAWVEMLAYFSSIGKWTISMKNIPENSASVEFFKKNYPNNISKEDTTPKIILPTSFEEYLMGLNRKDRHELRRKVKKFDLEHEGIKVVEEKNIDEFLRLMSLDQRKQNFLTEDLRDFFMGVVGKIENVKLTFLVCSGIKIAGVMSFNDDVVYYLYNSGFDEINHSNASFYLKVQTIKQAIELGLREYNFLQGDERYKYDLGGKDFLVYSVKLERGSQT